MEVDGAKAQARLWGRRLRAAMAFEELSQQAFAAMLGVHQQTVSDWVLGKCTPDDAEKRRIADLLGVPLGHLFGTDARRVAS